MLFLSVLYFLIVSLSRGSNPPEQIHLSHKKDGVVNVEWVTPYIPKGTTYLQWGDENNLSFSFESNPLSFIDGGSENRTIYTYLATMSNLESNTKYHYRVGGDYDDWSDILSMKTPPKDYPLRIFWYGDLGTEHPDSISIEKIQDEIVNNNVDMVIHVGDFAYDMNDQNGRTGDLFMNSIEPIASAIPYMVCLGNHESAYNFSHYTYRFRGQPSTNKLPEITGQVGMPNNWYFSYDVGEVHFIAFSTEIYFDYSDLIEEQYNWIKEDLQNLDRQKTKWVLLYGHRPMYCSCDTDCDFSAEFIRNGINGKYGIEELAYQFKIDIVIFGHEHNYERMYAIYQNKTITKEINGFMYNPSAPVNIVTGSAGSKEYKEPFDRPQPDLTAFRTTGFSYSRMTIYNDSAILWEQILTDTTQPPELLGKVIDYFWLIKTN